LSSFKIITFFTLFSVVGVTLIPLFSVDLQPAYNLPTITISYGLPGAPPEVVEREATGPIENIVSQITGIQKIYSKSTYHAGLVELTFDKSVDIDFKKFEITSAIRQTYPKLNQRITHPIVEHRPIDNNKEEILLLYYINAKASSKALGVLIDDYLISELSQIKGVNEIQVAGTVPDEIIIKYDTEKARLYGIETQAIARKIQELSSSSFAGRIKLGSGQKLLLETQKSINSLAQVEHIILTDSGKPVYLKDIATVSYQEATPRYHFRINGRNSVTLRIFADAGVNRITLASEVKAQMAQLAQKLPSDVNFHLDYDGSAYLVKEIRKNYIRAAVACSILLSFLLVTYRDGRYLAILSLGMITSLSLSLLLAYLFGVSFHTYSIAGVTIAFGMILDNSIIILDQLKHRKGLGILKSITTATLSTIVALSLVFALPEEDRRNLSDFSLVISIILFCSLLTSAFFIPALVDYIGSHSPNGHQVFSNRRLLAGYQKVLAFLSRRKKMVLLMLVVSFGLPIFMLPAKLDDAKWYNVTIGSAVYQEGVRPITDKLLGGALRLFVRYVHETSNFRDLKRTRLFIHAELPIGHTLEHMNELIMGMENHLENIVEVDKFISEVYSSEFGAITITFRDNLDDPNFPYKLKARLIAASLLKGGVKWNIFGVGQGFSSSTSETIPNLQVKLTGYNYTQLEKYSLALTDRLSSHERVENINPNEKLKWNEKPSEQLILELEADRLIPLGLDRASVARSLSKSSRNLAPSLYLLSEGSRLPVFLNASAAENLSTYSVTNRAMLHDSVTFNLLGRAYLKKEKTAAVIHKENRQYIRVVSFDYFGSQHFGNKYLDQVLVDFENELQPGYSAEKTSWTFSWDKITRYYGLLGLLVLAIFALCVVYYQDFVIPAFIIISVPVSFIGLFLTFYLFEVPFDEGGYAAFIMLGGVVINSSIFLTHGIVSHRRTAATISKAVFRKMKPILLTVTSTCLGMTPFIIGSENEIFWFGLAAGVIGGLLLSLVNTLFLLPAFLINQK
jgi:multidrug efflux pump subunit AcrB